MITIYPYLVRKSTPAVQESDERKQEEEGESLEGGILEAAVGLADESGLDALAIRKLLQALGTAPMTIYHHLKSKDEIESTAQTRKLDSALVDSDRFEQNPTERGLVEIIGREVVNRPSDTTKAGIEDAVGIGDC